MNYQQLIILLSNIKIVILNNIKNWHYWIVHPSELLPLKVDINDSRWNFTRVGDSMLELWMMRLGLCL
jgi:hypothetical protein